MRYAQIVMGPAGSGKSTYCSTMVKHCESLRRSVHVVNLDPAAEHFDYPVLADIRDLISIDDAMEELGLGPNGGLIFCMEHFAQNFHWLDDALDEVEDDYIIFDCPGQIELYTHLPVMRQFVDKLRAGNFNICGVFLLDSQYIKDASKFVSGVLSTLSAMVTLEIPHVSVMSKIDQLGKREKADLEKYLIPDLEGLLQDEMSGSDRLLTRYEKLNHTLATMVDDYSQVGFLPLDITDIESVGDVLLQIDTALQYGEDIEPREPADMCYEDPDDADAGDDRQQA